MMSSASTGGTEGSSPASSPVSAASVSAMAAPKFGTLVPNRIFVGGISASTSEAELTQLFSAYGNVKNTKIISDRAGVSKGYGFVTFETDEEAKKLQRESECIILRERKLNIAPAIKKQPLNRSFDGGSGSPPAVPASTYYYTNGMGLTYQNGLAFYNAGGPAPGTPIAPPTDPATIYQTAGVFGPQATSGHQTFAPIVYSCPAPSLYMPQQYPYSPMPYESYFAGAGGASGPPQYTLYTTSPANNQQQQQQQQTQVQNGITSGNGVTAAGNGGTATPPSLASLPLPPGHFYASPGPPQPPQQQQHHHPPPPTAIAAVQPQQPQQIDHLYYSFATAAPPPQQQQQTTVLPPQQQQQQQQHQTIGISEQPMLLYTTDPINCQQLTNNDSRNPPQEDTLSTTSQSERSLQQQQQQQHEKSNETQQQRQTQHIHRQQQQQHQQQTFSPASQLSHSLVPLKYPIISPRYANYHPIAVPTSYALLSGLDNQDRTKSNPLTSRNNIVNCTNYLEASRYYGTEEITCTNRYPFVAARNGVCTPLNTGNFIANTVTVGYNNYLDYRTNDWSFRRNYNTNSHRFNHTNYTNDRCSVDHQNKHQTANKRDFSRENSNRGKKTIIRESFQQTGSIDSSRNETETPIDLSAGNVRKNDEIGGNPRNSSPVLDRNHDCSPPPAPYSPMTRPIPNISPPVSQIQFYSTGGTTGGNSAVQTRNYQQQQHQNQSSHQFSQQQGGQRRYPSFGQSIGTGRKTSGQSGSSEVLRRPKKINGVLQSVPVGSGKLRDENCLGGGGDAASINNISNNRTPITPPLTPRTHSVNPNTGGTGNVVNNSNINNDSNQIDTCHRMQALTL